MDIPHEPASEERDGSGRIYSNLSRMTRNQVSGFRRIANSKVFAKPKTTRCILVKGEPTRLIQQSTGRNWKPNRFSIFLSAVFSYKKTVNVIVGGNPDEVWRITQTWERYNPDKSGCSLCSVDASVVYPACGAVVEIPEAVMTTIYLFVIFPQVLSEV